MKNTLRPHSLTVAIAIISVLTFGVTSALADTYLGLLVGPSFVSHDGGTDFNIGGHIGSEVIPGFSLGFYGTHQSLSSNAVASSGETTLAVEGNIHPVGSEFVYVGAKAGIGITSDSYFGASGSQTNFVFGPAAGFNIPILPSLTVGAEVNVLFLEATDTVTFVNLLGTVTLHF